MQSINSDILLNKRLTIIYLRAVPCAPENEAYEVLALAEFGRYIPEHTGVCLSQSDLTLKFIVFVDLFDRDIVHFLVFIDSSS